MASDRDSVDGDAPSGFVAAMRKAEANGYVFDPRCSCEDCLRERLPRARALLEQRQRESELASKLRGELRAARKTASAYLAAQERAKVQPQIDAAFDVIERETLSWGIYDQIEHDVDPFTGIDPSQAALMREHLANLKAGALPGEMENVNADGSMKPWRVVRGERVDLDYKERWALDVSGWLEPHEQARVLAEHDGKPLREESRRARLAAKAARERRMRVLTKVFGKKSRHTTR